jgi:uncharacterized protein with FMN-binding domain
MIDRIIAKQNTNVDVVSGATFSSKGIVQAVEDALKKALVKQEDTTTSDDSNDNTNQDNSSDSSSNSAGDATYTGTAVCEPDEDGDFYAYDLSLEIVVSGGKVTAINNVKGSGGQIICQL